MKFNSKLTLNIILLFYVVSLCSQEASSIVFEDSEGCLRYVMDENDNRIVDFSFAGYQKGEETIPTVEVVATLSPIAGDNTSFIQAAIDSVANLSPNAEGIRGAILLTEGIYEIGLGLADWTAQATGTLSPITSSFIPVGSRTIKIGSPELYNNGDEVIIFHPSTDAWLASINYGRYSNI